jgi:hypothetical protein
MVGYIGVVYYNQMARNALRRERVSRDHLNPFDRYDDIDFKYRYRFTKELVNNLINLLDVMLMYEGFRCYLINVPI